MAGDGDQPTPRVPLLADLALKPAVEQALLSGSNELELIMAISDKKSKIKEILRSCQNPIPDSGIPLLSKLLELEIYDQHKKTVDISQLPLSNYQILDIVAQHADLGVLNISHNKQITIDIVEKVLVALPNLRQLLALNTSITEEDAIALLERRPELFRNLEGFIHPAFLTNPSKARSKGAYVHIATHRRGSYAVSLPFFTTSQIVQGLTDYLNPLAFGNLRDGPEGMSYMTKYKGPAMAAYASQVRRPGQSWEDLIVSSVPAIFPPAQSLARKGRPWLFVLLPTWGFESCAVLYAFVRVRGEVWDEYLKMTEQIDGKAEDSTAPMSSQTNSERVSQLCKELELHLFEIFDVQQFFKELELEGREPPSPEALSRLFDVFSKLDGRESYC